MILLKALLRCTSSSQAETDDIVINFMTLSVYSFYYPKAMCSYKFASIEIFHEFSLLQLMAWTRWLQHSWSFWNFSISLATIQSNSKTISVGDNFGLPIDPIKLYANKLIHCVNRSVIHFAWRNSACGSTFSKQDFHVRRWEVGIMEMLIGCVWSGKRRLYNAAQIPDRDIACEIVYDFNKTLWLLSCYSEMYLRDRSSMRNFSLRCLFWTRWLGHDVIMEWSLFYATLETKGRF